MRAFARLAAPAAVALLALTAAPASAEPTSMFILDVSGSMWGQLPDRQTKIAAARKVMREVVGKLPDTVSSCTISMSAQSSLRRWP